MSILAQRHKQPATHATTAFTATTFQPDGALVALLRVETNFDSHSFVTLHVLQPLSTVWETGSPRPSDNLLFQRTMAGYFPITWDCFCLCMSTIVICISLHFINMRLWTCSWVPTAESDVNGQRKTRYGGTFVQIYTRGFNSPQQLMSRRTENLYLNFLKWLLKMSGLKGGDN